MSTVTSRPRTMVSAELWILEGVYTWRSNQNPSLISSLQAESIWDFQAKEVGAGTWNQTPQPSDRQTCAQKVVSHTRCVENDNLSISCYLDQSKLWKRYQICLLPGQRKLYCKGDDVTRLTSGKVVKPVWQVCVQVLLAALVTFTNPLVMTPFDWLNVGE